MGGSRSVGVQCTKRCRRMKHSSWMHSTMVTSPTTD
jgi:hypothetical protein